jgi:hypothetical protein
MKDILKILHGIIRDTSLLMGEISGRTRSRPSFLTKQMYCKLSNESLEKPTRLKLRASQLQR